MIGLQGRVSPIVLKLKELLGQGIIGKAVSSEVRASGGTIDRLFLPSFMDYFADLKVGGTLVTIGVGYLLDLVQHVVGRYQSVQSTLQIQRPSVRIVDRETKETIITAQSDVSDLVITSGTLQASSIVHTGATLVFRVRRGQSFPSEDALIWIITGEHGERRLSPPGGAALNATPYIKPVILQLHNHRSDVVSTYSWEWTDWQTELPIAGT